MPAVEGSTYGEDVGCGECHNDARSYGLAEVLSDWKKRSCESCHKPDSSAPQHAVNIATKVDGRRARSAVDRRVPAATTSTSSMPFTRTSPRRAAGSAERGEKGCHVLEHRGLRARRHHLWRSWGRRLPPQLQQPLVQSQAGFRGPLPNQREPAGDTSFFDTPCGDCHRMDPDGTSLTDEHAIPTSERTEAPNNVCLNCHNNAASAWASLRTVGLPATPHSRAPSATALRAFPPPTRAT